MPYKNSLMDEFVSLNKYQTNKKIIDNFLYSLLYFKMTSLFEVNSPDCLHHIHTLTK